MTRIDYTGIIYTTGTLIEGFTFSGHQTKGYVIEYYALGVWYLVRLMNGIDTTVIRAETAIAQKG